MDSLSIASLMTGMRHSQIQMAVQTQLLQMMMESQAQAVEQLLTETSEAAAINPPGVGNNLDLYV